MCGRIKEVEEVVRRGLVIVRVNTDTVKGLSMGEQGSVGSIKVVVCVWRS